MPLTDGCDRSLKGMNDTAIVTATALTKVYGSDATQVKALAGVSVSFGLGTFTAIMGPSGSGKSTMMHCLAGLDTPTAGTVTIDGVQLVGMPDRELTKVRREKVGFVFQAFNLLPTHTALQNILLPLELSGRKPDTALLDSLVSALGLTDRLNHLPSQLSGGEQQRVAVARALIGRPAVVFADEPTGALDSRNSAGLLAFLRVAAQNGQTIIMVTHDPRAASYTDRALMLRDGQIVADIAKPDEDTVLAAMKTLAA
jgi:putative ABC transport system ATP-binding protein